MQIVTMITNDEPVARRRVLTPPASLSWLMIFLSMSNLCCLALSCACDSCFSLRAVCSCLQAQRVKWCVLFFMKSQELWTITCHMRSHSVTCHLTQVNTPHLNHSQATESAHLIHSYGGWHSIYLPREMEGWVDLGGWLYRFTCQQRVNHPSGKHLIVTQMGDKPMTSCLKIWCPTITLQSHLNHLKCTVYTTYLNIDGICY